MNNKVLQLLSTHKFDTLSYPEIGGPILPIYVTHKKKSLDFLHLSYPDCQEELIVHTWQDCCKELKVGGNGCEASSPVPST